MEAEKSVELPKRRSGFKRIVVIVTLVLLLCLGGWCYWQYFATYSIGKRYGLLQKFSYRGNVFKTYEGELILSSVRGNANVPIASEKFYFSVTAVPIAQQLMNLQGHNVTVHYKQKNGTAFWRGDTEYLVDSVSLDQ